jgi:hypothetical protein
VKAALAARFEQAKENARDRGSSGPLDEFHEAVNHSCAVLSRPLAKVAEMVNSDNELYTTFYQLVEASARLPEDNEWDRGRASVDSLLFPHYHQDIRFAALSLDGSGLTGYGDVTIVLSEVSIRARATVFEKNTVQFCREHGVIAGGTVPLGYRAEWTDRGMLAVAKLHAKILPDTTKDQFPGILMDQSGATTADFIEVHIYGPIHRKAFTRVLGKKPKRGADKVLLRSIKAKLRTLNISLEELP